MSSQLFQLRPEQSGFCFPQQLTEKYQPRTLDEFCGLDKPKKIAQRLISEPRESTWYFLGPSGTGKTTLAQAIATAIPAELHHIPAQECNVDAIARAWKSCNYVPMAGLKCHLLLIEEADQMTPAAQIALLSKLDSTGFPPNTIVIMTGNSVERLEPRFMSRCHVVEFSSYGISKEVTALLERVWAKETAGEAVAPPNFARIVKDNNNNVRGALMSLETELMSR